MKKQPSEFDNFDTTIGRLLAVPYSELQGKLEEEKRTKAKEKKKLTTSPASGRASSNSKKRAA